MGLFFLTPKKDFLCDNFRHQSAGGDIWGLGTDRWVVSGCEVKNFPEDLPSTQAPASLKWVTNSLELSASFACKILLSYEELFKILVHMCVCVHVMCVYLYFDMNVDSDNCSAFLHIQLHLFLFLKSIFWISYWLRWLLPKDRTFMYIWIMISSKREFPASWITTGIECKGPGGGGDALGKMRGYFLLADGTTRLNRCSMKWKN